MAETSLAHSAQESTRRVERGRELFEERYNEIEWVRGNEWYVPASSLLSECYVVRLGDNPACECADFSYRHRECYHIHAARIAHRKSACCSCCGRRVPNRFLSEVTEDDNLLSWFEGDLICADCVRAGYYV